jgi:two-component system sensor histidine kinase YesM
MDSKKLNNIRNSLNETEDDSGKRIGLKNVHQRIKLHYGDDYGLKISSEPDQGTRIDILLPEKG